MTTEKDLKIQDLTIKIENILEDMDYSENYENNRLPEAMEYFCSNHDKGRGMKYAIRETLTEQYNNHREDLTEEELQKLLDILTK